MRQSTGLKSREQQSNTQVFSIELESGTGCSAGVYINHASQPIEFLVNKLAQNLTAFSSTSNRQG